jgi:restriction system protein
MQGGDEEYAPPDNFPVLVSQAVVIPYEKTFEGELIRAVTIPLLDIIRKIIEDPSRVYEIDPRKWEEIIAATHEQSGLFDEVTLTPWSGDRGKDLIVVKKGFGSVRFVESVKRYTPGRPVKAEEVDALIGVLNKQPQTSKGIISTTWEFAPKIMDDPDIARLAPMRLELVNGKALVERFREYTQPIGDTLNRSLDCGCS